jgi:hypothetical protein
MNATFEMNGITYRTDAATLEVLRSIIPAAKASNDYSAVAAVMHLGLASGRICEVK